MHPSVRRPLLFAAACAGMFTFGIVGALLGSLFGFPEIRQRFDVDFSRLGDLFTVLYSGLLATTVVAGPVIDRFGARLLLSGSSALTAVAFVLFATGRGYRSAVLAAAVIGIGGGGLNVATNALVSDLFAGDRGRRLSDLAAFFGVGALFVPLAAATIGSADSIPLLLAASAAMAACCAAAYLALPFPQPVGDHHAFTIREIPAAIAQPGVALLALLLFFQTGNEAMVGGWVSSYVGHAGWTARAATAVLAGYWVAVIVGRWLAGRLHGFVPGRWLLLAAGVGSVAGIGWLMAAQSFATLTAAALTTSLALSWIYPTALALAGDRYHKMAGTVFGALFTLGAVGGMVMPPILGRISEASGLRAGMSVPLAGAVMVSLLAVVVGFRTRRTPR